MSEGMQSLSLKYTSQLKYKNVKWLSIKFEWWGRKMCPRHLPWLREKRLLQATEPEQKFSEGYWEKEKDFLKNHNTKKITNWSNCKTLTYYNYFEYHWCVLEIKIKRKRNVFNNTQPYFYGPLKAVFKNSSFSLSPLGFHMVSSL
jgi:hypothetical protein